MNHFFLLSSRVFREQLNVKVILGKQFWIGFLIHRPPWFSLICSVDTAKCLIELTAEVLG